MKFDLLIAWTTGAALLSGCQFHRSPVTQMEGSVPATAAGTVAPPPPNVPVAPPIVPPDAALPANPAPPMVSVPTSIADAAVSLEDDSGVVGMGTGPISMQPPAPPMTGGLSCAGVFCPFVLDPGKPCCTAASDVTARLAREPGRCGVDLSALQSSTYGDGCWQRDQLGVLDAECPDLQVGGLTEPGCCTDSGECGTANADQKLGCRHGPGSELRSCGDQSAGKSCDPLGSYGLRVSVDVTWGGTSGFFAELTADGRGRVDVFLLGTISGVDPATGELAVKGRVCGATFPPFESLTLCESYQTEMRPEIWESPALPPLELAGRYECSASGCSLSIDPETFLLGIELLNPESPWPAPGSAEQLRCRSGRGAACFPDHDDDGHPGVLVNLLTTGTMPTSSGCDGTLKRRSVPLAESLAVIVDGARRSDRALLGMRTKLGGTVRLGEDCDRATGSAIADYLSARAFGCLVEQGTYNVPRFWEAAGPDDLCTSEEAKFVDTALPVYSLLAAGETPSRALTLTDRSVSRGPEVSLVRLGSSTDAISCEQVRDAAY